ncbi:odorant receptor 42a-like isoform 1-T1 [Glossina fuscipes fuscipes]
MHLLRTCKHWLKERTETKFFKMAYFREDGPPPKTRDAVLYLFRGITIIGLLTPDYNKKCFYVWSLFLNSLVTLYMPVGFLLSFIMRLHSFSPSEFFTSLQISINCVGASLKLFVFSLMYKRLIKATKYMDRLDQRPIDKQGEFMLRQAVAYSNCSSLLFTLLYLSYSSSTFLSSVINGRPPYQIYNPFIEWRNSTRNFIIQSAIEYVMIDFHCYQQALLDAYPVIYIMIIRAHLHILSRRISKLGKDEKLKKNQRYEALVQCVLDHKNIMHLYNLFSPVISGTMFVQFLIIGIILGVTTIHIVLFANFFAIVASLFYVASILAETFPCSYLANSLMDDSDELSLAIFHSGWPNEEPRYKQVVVFFLQHTQKTLVLTAMKIFPITMNSNINVVKFAFSVYTLISQMDLKQKLKDSVTGQED